MMTLKTYVAHYTLTGDTIGNCYTFNDRYTRKDSKENTKEDNHKKDEDNHEEKGFQKPRGTVAVIFSGAPDCTSKRQEKLALRTIMTENRLHQDISIGHNIQSNFQEKTNGLA